MIELVALAAWGDTHPWQTSEQIEQDLMLSRAICEIANDEYLGDELVFRGGTALNKLYMDEAIRYSNDLDYVRATSGGIASLTSALTRIGEQMGFGVTTKIARHPKVYWKAAAFSGFPIKIESPREFLGQVGDSQSGCEGRKSYVPFRLGAVDQ